jgi:hypothetical protein
MAIEIRNLSISSRIVQRRQDDADEPAGADAGSGPPADNAAPLALEWEAERRRLAAELFALRRER